VSPTLLHSPPQGAEISPEIAVVPCFGVDGGSVPARSSAEKPESSGIGDPVEGCGARGGKWRTSTARARAPAARRRLAPLVPLVPLAERAESFAQRRRAGRIAPARRPAGGVLRPFSGHLRDGRRGVAPTRASRPMARTAHPGGHGPPRADRRAGAIGRRAASSGTCFARSAPPDGCSGSRAPGEVPRLAERSTPRSRELPLRAAEMPRSWNLASRDRPGARQPKSAPPAPDARNGAGPEGPTPWRSVEGR
jgi:hypothetical protein